MAPDELKCECSGSSINAHTISRSRSLNSISKGDHVYGVRLSPQSFDKNGKQFKFERIGTRKVASTFRGFCEKHDNDLFAPIEKHIFEHTIESYFILGYRGLCRDLYAKESSIALEENKLVKIAKTLTLEELYGLKKEQDKILLSKDYNTVRALVISLNQPPPLMTSFSTSPDFDFANNQIQDLEKANAIELDKRTIKELSGKDVDLGSESSELISKHAPEMLKPLDSIGCNSIYDGKKGRIVFTWLESSDLTANKFIQSLLLHPKSDIPSYLLQFCLGYSENCFLAPDWWEALTEDQQSFIEKYIYTSVKETKPGYSFFPNWANMPFPQIAKISSFNCNSISL